MCEPEELRPIEALETPVCERLYDLHGDPSEIKNIAKANPALRRSMMRRLMEWINSQVSGEPTKHNDAFRKELQKKGYWQEDTTEKNKQRKEGDQEIIRIDSMSARVTHIVRPTITVPEGTPTDQPVACRVRFVVDVNGVPTKTEVIACHEDHVASVQQIANEWRFEPWTVDGEAIPFVVVKEIRFSLEVESASQ